MSALDRYKEKKTASKVIWTPPTLADFAQDLTVMSFDQSLARTGWVFLRVSEGRVEVLGRGTLRTVEPEGVTGWRANFARARLLKSRMTDVEEFLVRLSEGLTLLRWPDAVVLELPSVHGQRTDSSMMAAYEISDYCETWWRPTEFISIQQTRTILGGSNIRNDKKGGWKALVRYIPESESRQWNEHQRDAAINALGHLYNLREKADGPG